VSPERDEPTEDQEQELYEDVPPRSIFAATWFRVVLVVIVLGVIGAVAVPYVLDWMNPPPPPRSASSKAPASSAAPLPPSVFDKPAADKPVADRPFADRPAADKPTEKPVVDKKDPLPPARMEPKPGASSTTPSSSAAPSSSLTPKSATTATPKPAEESKPAPKPALEPKATAKATPTAPKPAPAEAKPAESPAKVAATTTDSAASTAKPAPKTVPKSEPKPAAATKPTATKPAAAKATPAAPAASGPFWVQVGAFKDAETARKLASKLRDANFKVEESVKAAAAPKSAPPAPAATATPSAPAGADQYDVFVSGMSVEELNKRLAGKGLAAETSAGGVVIKPSLPLRDAVSLSKDLAVEGFKVQVKRAPGSGSTTTPPSAASAPAAPTAGEGGPQLHRVRVGAFADRAAAQAAAKELEAKGYKPYIARGDQ
jgi:hypothetical protein